MDYQQPRPYMTPTPPHLLPSTADPYQRPPPPPSQPWSSYSAPQFHYQPQPQHSPSPPQWPPPPPPPPVHSSDHSYYPPYPSHQLPPYPAHPHYPPGHPVPPRLPHVPQSYSQDWENESWGHHQNWDYQEHNNEDDWATKARAWAAAKAASENQIPQVTPARRLEEQNNFHDQVTPARRLEEQNNFHDQYSQPVDTQYMDVQQSLASASRYQHYPVGTAPPYRNPLGQSQEPPFISSGQSSYAIDVHLPSYTARDGNLAGDTIPFSQQEKSSMISLVHQQEVPSSYSSIAGKEAGSIHGDFNRSSSLPPVAAVSQLYVQPLPPAVGRSGWVEEPHYSQQAEFSTDLSDQPLNFEPHFNCNLDPHLQSHAHSSGGPARAVDPVAAISSNYSWAPAASESVYPSQLPTIPLGSQVDHSIVVPSPASGHSTPMFPTGANFQPTGPIIGASFGVCSGSSLHPTVAFNGDAFGVSSVSERPRKASVPNWLREEIIKNKASIPSSVPEYLKEDSQSMEEESGDKSSRKGDQADNKSIDSSISTEDEEEEEVEVEAARSAAINQEIKRVLTEVLLKVTDELFDEIATKVLNEDGLTVEVDHNTDLSKHKVLPSTDSTPAGSTPKPSAEVLIPTKTKGTVSVDASEKSAASGDVLGLANYASDDEEVGIQSSGKLESRESSSHEQSISSKLLIGSPAVQHGGSKEEAVEQGNIITNAETEGTGKTKANNIGANLGTASTELNDDRAARQLACSDNIRGSGTESGVSDETRHGYDTSKSKDTLIEKAVETVERQDRNSDARMSMRDDSPGRHTRHRSDKNDRSNNKKNHEGKDDDKVVESFKERMDKGDDEHRRHEERHARDEKTDDCNGLKDIVKGLGKSGEKVKDSESRNRHLPFDVKEGRQQTDRDKSSGKENDRRERTKDELRDRSRHKNGSDSSRHKRRRPSFVDGRGRKSKDNSVVSHAYSSSDESLDDSKRKLHHSRKRKSPSPVRLRKRQVSRSPHRKHSQRRHSPYSSLENTRRRSRSRSPFRRR